MKCFSESESDSSFSAGAGSPFVKPGMPSESPSPLGAAFFITRPICGFAVGPSLVLLLEPLLLPLPLPVPLPLPLPLPLLLLLLLLPSFLLAEFLSSPTDFVPVNVGASLARSGWLSLGGERAAAAARALSAL